MPELVEIAVVPARRLSVFARRDDGGHAVPLGPADDLVRVAALVREQAVGGEPPPSGAQPPNSQRLYPQ